VTPGERPKAGPSTCAGMKCPTPVRERDGDRQHDGQPRFLRRSGAGREFFRRRFVLVRAVGGGNPITFALEAPTSGTIGGEAWNWVTPFSTGSFTPAPGADFPGPYADLVQCTTAGNICGPELNFTASGADATHPFVIGQPRGAGNFLNFVLTLCPSRVSAVGIEPATIIRLPIALDTFPTKRVPKRAKALFGRNEMVDVHSVVAEVDLNPTELFRR
jgi:hypothetical protein